jgi:hypothetical protein
VSERKEVIYMTALLANYNLKVFVYIGQVADPALYVRVFTLKVFDYRHAMANYTQQVSNLCL